MFFTPIFIYSQQKDTTFSSKIFANIYSGAFLKNSNQNNSYGFYLSTALLGYSKQISKNLKGTIIFDVTRTTNNIQVTDTSGNFYNVSFFEGSKYTAFLKMAAIDWQFNKNFSLSVGQLLNTQYLTFQDKFWEHRYVEVTFQELNKFGMPADFGLQLNYHNDEKYKINIGAFNGEGPFRHQDKNSDILISGNIEFYPFSKFVLKTYFANHFSNKDSLKNKQTISFFGGFKNQLFTLGLEYNYINSADFLDNDYSGLSVFSFFNFSKKWQIFYRYDFIIKSADYKNKSYHITGLQFKPAKTFFISTNYRFFTSQNTNMIFFNFGLKF